MNRKRIIWLVIALLVILVSVSIATYAYYIGKELYVGSFDVDIESKGVDILQFDSTEDVSFLANAENFSKENGEDVYGEGIIDIDLTTTKKETKYCYEVSFKFPDEQVFDYSEYGRPELVLDIYKKTNDEEYKKVIDNLDITTSTGTIRVPIEKGSSKYQNEISTTKNVEKKDSWKAVVTYKFFPDVFQGINDDKEYNSALKVNIVKCQKVDD